MKFNLIQTEKQIEENEQNIESTQTEVINLRRLSTLNESNLQSRVSRGLAQLEYFKKQADKYKK